ncbi:MAG TPA: hypothetical protein VMU88_02595, partial [bacterium]|nr:hypothetical protein [bacterium]
MTPEFTTEQLTQSMKDWAPAPDLAARLSARLKRGGVEAEFTESLAAGLALCARSTYDYLQCIHDFATNRELDAKNLLPQMAHWAFLIQNLKAQATAYDEAFQRYNAAAQPRLKRDTFDTHYYDAILGLDVREMLKGLLGEVEVLLQSMTLASQDLAGVDGLGIYE